MLDELSNSAFAHPISIYPEVGEVLYALARNVKPKVAVEIGSFIGYSAICIAQAIEDNKQTQGNMYAIDNFLPHINNPNLPIDIENPLELAKTNVEKAGLMHRVNFIKGFSTDVAPKLLSQIKNIDLLFIDGDHTYKGTLNDYNIYNGKVRKGGLIIFHDIFPNKCGWWGPRIILDTLKSVLFRSNYEILEIETPEGYGLAVCKKLKEGNIEIKNNFILEKYRKALVYLKEGGSLKSAMKYISRR
ncbi:MAG: CmcI family methyltransferase [Deltaproteobacteria bacterium]